MEIAGYIGAVFIGLSLGLIGGGGSALAVPVLVYLFHISPQSAVPDSLFIVGLSALIGALGYVRKNLVSYKSILVFGIPSLITVFLTRKFLFPAIPGKIILYGGISINKDMMVLILFSMLMLAASFSMIRPAKIRSGNEQRSIVRYNYPLIILSGLFVGFLAGVVGAGGGFLIIPVLVILAKLPMKMAVGTSLVIIFINSSIGFLGDLHNGAEISWAFLVQFCSFSVFGIFLGIFISKFISGNLLKSAFGWFILAIGTFIISEQIIKMHLSGS